MLLTARKYYQLSSTPGHVQKCYTCQKKNVAKNANETFAER